VGLHHSDEECRANAIHLYRPAGSVPCEELHEASKDSDRIMIVWGWLGDGVLVRRSDLVEIIGDDKATPEGKADIIMGLLGQAGLNGGD
jgi:hypothetical protein